MYLISTNKKTGFRSIDGERVKIYRSPKYSDAENMYDYTPKGTFNLPSGTYYTDNKLKQCKPVNFSLVLPKFERNEKPKNLRIVGANHPHKCIVYRGRNLIVYDKSYFSKLKPIEKLFVLAHELGHYKYETELYCDLYAANELLKIGYNPSQIARCPFYALSDRNNDRKLQLLNELIKVKK